MSNSVSIKDCSTLISTQKKEIPSQKCRICDEPADYLHFGVISCPSCKIFFKRYAQRGQNAYKCIYDGQCDININTRHICKHCRLKKCFQSGMTPDKFRAPLLFKAKAKTRTLVKTHSQYEFEQLPTINLLRSDNSLLTIDDWTYLSNLCHIYQESQLVSTSQRLIDADESLQTSININYNALAEEYLTCLYEATATYLRLNNNLSKLTSDDRSIVLRNAANHITCLSSTFMMCHYHLLSLRNFYKLMTMKYGKSTVDIERRLAKYIDPDIILVKLSLSLFAFSQTTYLYDPNNTIYLTDSISVYDIQSKYVDIMWKYLIYKYGHYEAVKRFTNIILWLLSATAIISHCQSLARHVNNVESLVEQTEISLVLDDVDEIIPSNS